jgi:hypothetical protein
MYRTLPEFHASGLSFTAEWPHTHTLDVSADDVHVRVGDLLKIEMITISGFMRWQRAREKPNFKVMRRVPDGEPFAGALIALGDREGHMFAFVISDSRTMGVHIVQLEERHLNMIRQLSLQTSSLSGNAIYRLCFRISSLSCCVPFTLVRWCPSLSAAIVTQLVTHAAFFSGMLSGGLSLIPQPLSNLFLGGRHRAGQSGSLVPHAVTNPARRRVRR